MPVQINPPCCHPVLLPSRAQKGAMQSYHPLLPREPLCEYVERYVKLDSQHHAIGMCLPGVVG